MATARDNLARKQIFIPATQPETELCLRVAAYCRVSSDSDDQINSFIAQNTHYHELITSHEHWELVDVYADEGITGTSAKKRDDFQRMLNDCRNGKIDKILVKSISRFARNTTDCLDAIWELKAMGISVFFEEQNIDTKMVSSEMLTAVIAACAQAESESISRNMRWGLQKRMEQGTYVPSSVPYGYRAEGDTLVVYEPEAAVVRRIYEAYLTGLTAPEIAAMLTEEGNTDREWHGSTVKYILRNERYTGRAIFQKTYTTQTLPYQRKINKGELAKYQVENTNPAIISEEMYQAVQALISKKFRHRASKPGDHPLSGQVECAVCGAPCMVRFNNGKSYVSCRTHDFDACSCTTMPVRVETIYHAFMRLHFNLTRHPEILTDLWKNLRTIRDRRMLWGTDVIDLNRRISDIIGQIHCLNALNKQGIIAADLYVSQSNQLAAQLCDAKQQREKLQGRKEDDLIGKTEAIIEVLEEGPDTLDAFDEELFCELIDKIVVESNTRIRFRLKNGLELPESIERTER